MDSHGVAARLKQPSWRDPRLIVGIVLVALSVAGCWQLVRTARATTAVFAAAVDLPAGARVGPADVTSTEVKLSSAGKRYLGAGSTWPKHLVALRTVAAGELIPAAAVGDAATLAGRSVIVHVDGPLPDGVVPGARVDLWAVAQRQDDDKKPVPERVAGGVRIVALHAPTSSFGIDKRVGVELLVDEDDVAAVLQMNAGRATISILSVPGKTPSGARTP